MQRLMNANETLLVMFQVRQGIPGINSQVFSTSAWERGHFPVFLLFKLWITESPKIFKQILMDLFVITKMDHLTNVPTFIEIHGTKRQRKMASFFSFSKCHFLTFQAHFLQGILGKI